MKLIRLLTMCALAVWLLCVGCACTVSGDPSVSDASDGQTQGIGDSVTLPPMTEENTVGGETVPADTAETEAESTVSAKEAMYPLSELNDILSIIREISEDE